MTTNNKKSTTGKSEHDVAVKIANYIIQQNFSDNRMSASTGWRDFFLQFPKLKSETRKPKQFCNEFNQVLQWIDGPKTAGFGYIAAVNGPVLVASDLSVIGLLEVMSQLFDERKAQVSGNLPRLIPAAAFAASASAVHPNPIATHAHTHTHDKASMEPQRSSVDIAFVLDSSQPSSRSSNAYEFLCDYVHAGPLSQETDSLLIVKFDDSVETIMPLTKIDKSNFPDCISSHVERNKFRCSGRRGQRRLWDSIKEAVKLLSVRVRGSKHPKPSRPHLVVLADGDDTCSNTSFEEVRNMLSDLSQHATSVLHKPAATFNQFHCTFISIGSDRANYVQQFNFIAERSSYVHHYRALGIEDIPTCFRKLEKTMHYIMGTSYDNSSISLQVSRPPPSPAKAAMVTPPTSAVPLPPPQECVVCCEAEGLHVLSCSHVVCQTCMTRSVTVGRASNKIIFNHLYCPMRCKVSLCGVSSIQKLVIGEAALMKATIYSALDKYSEEAKLRYSASMIKTATTFIVNHMLHLQVAQPPVAAEPCIENPLDVIDEALQTFDFFQCFKCQHSFFGGKHRCAAALPEDTPKENIVCGKCSSRGQLDCTIHGVEFIQFKCMFCCSRNPVTYICGGAQNYCTRCHQRPGTCYPCEPADCVFNGTHPPEAGQIMKMGTRYGLGCVLCNVNVCAEM